MKTTDTSSIDLQLVAHAEYSYVPRTTENAKGADVTVAFAVDFNTAGERLTKREAGVRYVGITYGIDPAVAAASLLKFLVERKGSSLNVAGNGIYTFAENLKLSEVLAQAQANQWVFDVLSRVVAKIPLVSLRSGGQTGIDQAGLVAAVALGIPAIGLYPKSFRRRNAKGEEIHSTSGRMREELLSQVQKLVLPRKRRFHPDKSQPPAGAYLVFGSNLAGRHGAGSALLARESFGAIYGQGEGLQGTAYAVPTKDGRPGTPDLKDPKATLSLESIRKSIFKFIAFAKENPTMQFHVVRLGCDLATHKNADIAPLFADAPDNCSFPDPWEPFLGQASLTGLSAVKIAEPINIWTGARGIGGALTNMSERSKEKGSIKHSYPVTVNGRNFADSEAAYQAMKISKNEAYNDGLMIDLICLKFQQNALLREVVDENGGSEWLRKCAHFTQAVSERAKSWEGQGYSGSRFIRNLVHGYEKALTGRGPVTRVVHVHDAPFDEYIGRAMGQGIAASIWKNENRVTSDTPLGTAVKLFHQDLMASPELLARLPELQGRTLGCWCKSKANPEKECHGDVLATMAEGREWVPPTAVQQSLF